MAATLLIAALAWGQAQAQPQWKDGEYPLYEAFTKATDAAAKLKALEAWQQKFPDSAINATRLELFVSTYQALNQPDKVLAAANEVIKLDPKNIRALWPMIVSVQQIQNPSAEQLAMGEKAAQTLATKIDELKPESASAADWEKSKAQLQAPAYAALGWIGVQRKNNAAAEAAYLQSLRINPASPQVSYMLGTMIIGQRDLETYGKGLFHIARAASYTGEGALDAANRKSIEDYLVKRYATFHGTQEGLDELRKLAASNAIPPDGFKIKSQTELINEQEESLKKTNPMLALWMSVKRELIGPNGAQYFEASVKETLLPGGVLGVSKFKGTLVEAKPPKNPKALVVAISDAQTPEVTLALDEPLVGSAPVGTELEFEGGGQAFTQDPFNLTLEVEKSKIVGWPAPAATKKATPATKKSTAPAKK
jgi:tetratricopeptide (TPR) repeat protein